MGQKSKKATTSRVIESGTRKPQMSKSHAPVYGLARQRTLKNPIKCTGIGLHGGQRVTMELRPAGINHGIVFRRSDIGRPDGDIAARYDYAGDLVLCTSVTNSAGARVGTVEHLMAALSGCGIDNLLVQIDGPEIPVMDGSAAPFVFLVECAGVVEQDAPRRFIQILKPVEVSDRDRSATLRPADRFSVSFAIDFESELVGAQSCYFEMRDGAFKSELSRARTFGFAGEVEKLHALGLALGGSLENAVVISGDRVLNEGGLRYSDEFVRHKALDSIGDLYLAGAPILGHFHGERSGHALNNKLLRALFADDSAWRYVSRPAEIDQVPQADWAEGAALATA